MLTRQKMNFRDTLTCHAAVVGRSTLLSFHASFKILQNISILHFCKKELKQDFHRQNCNFVTKRKRILIASRMLDSVVYHHQNHT